MTPAGVLAEARARTGALVALTTALAEIETASAEPGAHEAAFAVLAAALADVGFRSIRARGGALVALPTGRTRGRPHQVVVGHLDTVWPTGTLAARPVVREGDLLRGPGVYDMKAGLAQIVVALDLVRASGAAPEVTPVVVVNADEEVGSARSVAVVRRLARGADRALVLEPSLGPEGALKTARKGVGRYTLRVHGRAAHAGLDPEAGASAILELAHQVQALFALNDPARGVSVNVGQIDGGLRPNVVAPASRAVVDVRVPSAEEAERVDAAIRGLEPVLLGVRLEVEGTLGRPPMERSPASEALWGRAEALGRALGLALSQATAGGGSDGSTTSRYAPTLDGLGAVGGGAHAEDEHVRIGATVERAALLALLLREPPLGRA
jgi:glutamate carboxypeptidase